MVTFNQILRDIQSLKVQGATNVARAGLKALNLQSDATSINQILNSRPTEPAMQTTLACLLMGVDHRSLERTKNKLNSNLIYVSKHFSTTGKKIVQIGCKKIKKESIIFTHCHSSTVVKILLAAKKKYPFKVHNTETRPLYQGRILAKQLAKKGIEVTHYVDGAARYALRKADIFLMGADAITSEGNIINKVGSGLFAEFASKHNIPIYVCTDSWKFDTKTIQGNEVVLESRSSKEVWPDHPKNVKIENPAFEIVERNLITGIISELGIYSPQTFVEEMKKEYPFLFS